MNLLGKNVGDTLIEYVGPDTEFNNFISAAPTVLVNVVGTGEVTVYHNTTPVMRSASPTGPNGLAKDFLPDNDPANWAAISPAINQASGSGVSVPVPPTTGSRNFIRLVVTGAGTGEATIRSIWS